MLLKKGNLSKVISSPEVAERLLADGWLVDKEPVKEAIKDPKDPKKPFWRRIIRDNRT